MASKGALRDFAVWVASLQSNLGDNPNPRLQWIITRAQAAIAEDDRANTVAVRFRIGMPAQFAGERPRLVYATGATPAVGDTYVLDAGDRPTAEAIVNALNATPPS